MASWWIGKTRDDFAASAPIEQHRMAYDGKRPIGFYGLRDILKFQYPRLRTPSGRSVGPSSFHRDDE